MAFACLNISLGVNLNGPCPNMKSLKQVHNASNSRHKLNQELSVMLFKIGCSKKLKLFKQGGAKKKKAAAADPEEEVAEIISPLIHRYWVQRYDLFSKYDEGIQMDDQGWYSVTPEAIAVRQAHWTVGGGHVVVDGFAGVGGNVIQFAKQCNHVIAIDIDPQKVALAHNNAKVYGVENYIDFIVGDFFQLAPSLKGDVVFLSPPWGGPSYRTIENFTLDLLQPKDGYSMFQVAQEITPNIIMFLPRNIDKDQVAQLSWLSSPPLDVQIEENYVQNISKGITVYFSDTTSSEQPKDDQKGPV